MTSAGEVVTDVTEDDKESDGLALFESGFFIRAAMENSEAAWDSFLPSMVLVSAADPTGLDLQGKKHSTFSIFCNHRKSVCRLMSSTEAFLFLGSEFHKSFKTNHSKKSVCRQTLFNNEIYF